MSRADPNPGTCLLGIGSSWDEAYDAPRECGLEQMLMDAFEGAGITLENKIRDIAPGKGQEYYRAARIFLQRLR